MEITYTKKFVSEFKKLPNEVKILAEKKEKIFIKNPFDPKLKTHKLIGKLKDYWAFSIDYKHRIIFKLTDKKNAWFLSLGTHDVYRN